MKKLHRSFGLGLGLGALLLAWSSPAADFLFKNTGAVTNTAVYLPGSPGRSLSLISLDVTGTAAGDTLALAAGTTRYTAIKAALSTATNVVMLKSTTPVSNDVCLVQTAAGAVTAATVYTNTFTTNKLITLTGTLGTNLAVGDVLREQLTVPYTVQARAGATATTYFVDTTNGIAANDVLVLRHGGTLLSQTVSSATGITNQRVTLRNALTQPITLGDSLYERKTNFAAVTAVVAADGVNIRVATTNGFAAADRVLVETATGRRAVRTIDTAGVSTTNISLATTAGFALAVADRVWLLTTNDYITILPADVGDGSVLLDTSSGLAANDTLVIVPTGAPVIRNAVAATPTAEVGKKIVVGTTFGVVVNPGEVMYEASGTALTTTFAADKMDTQVICDVTTSLTNQDHVYIFPATGGVFENDCLAGGVNYLVSTVTFTGQIGGALAVGDSFYLLGSGFTLPIGNATVRRDNAAGIWSAVAGLPVRALLTGTNITLNLLTAKYAP